MRYNPETIKNWPLCPSVIPASASPSRMHCVCRMGKRTVCMYAGSRASENIQPVQVPVRVNTGTGGRRLGPPGDLGAHPSFVLRLPIPATPPYEHLWLDPTLTDHHLIENGWGTYLLLETTRTSSISEGKFSFLARITTVPLSICAFLCSQPTSLSRLRSCFRWRCEPASTHPSH